MFEVWVALHVDLSVGVRVAVAAPLVPKPVKKRLLLSGVDDVCHHVSHVDFYAQRVHKGYNVGVV